MAKTKKNCDPFIVNGTDLMTSDYEFITKEVLKEKCDCVHKATCFEILRLLEAKQVDKIKDLLPIGK